MFEPRKCRPGCVFSMCLRSGDVGSGGTRHCGFILKTGQSRGCDPGPDCNQYVRRISPRTGRKFTWDESRGRELWLEGRTDQEIADALDVKRKVIGETRRRKWQKEVPERGMNDGGRTAI